MSDPVMEINDVRDAQRILGAPAGRYSPEAIIVARMYLKRTYTDRNEKMLKDVQEFDANTGYSSNTDIYLSHCPLRRGASTKVHIGRGRAMSAIRVNAGSAWRLHDGKWIRIAYTYEQYDLNTGEMLKHTVVEDS